MTWKLCLNQGFSRLALVKNINSSNNIILCSFVDMFTIANNTQVCNIILLKVKKNHLKWVLKILRILASTFNKQINCLTSHSYDLTRVTFTG